MLLHYFRKRKTFPFALSLYHLTLHTAEAVWSVNYDGTCIPELFVSSAWENVKRKISLFSFKDREKQNWIIRASVSTLTPKEKPLKMKKVHAYEKTESNWTAAHFLKESAKIGDYLERAAFGDFHTANWLGLQGVGTNWKVDVCNYDLYDGLAGIALFLGYLSFLTHNPKYARLAWRACNQIYQWFQKEQEPLSIGAFNGWSGVIYGFTHLSSLLNDQKLIEWTHQIIERFDDPENDEELDWIGGAAGCLVVLLGLYVRTGSQRARSLAIRCGDHLIQKAIRSKVGLGWKSINDSLLTGMAHGAAGCAEALAKLFQATVDIRYREAAMSAAHFERSQFCHKNQNWFDWRGSNPDATVVQWCAGAPGIGLSRTVLFSLLNDPEYKEEIQIAMDTTSWRWWEY